MDTAQVRCPDCRKRLLDIEHVEGERFRLLDCLPLQAAASHRTSEPSNNLDSPNDGISIDLADETIDRNDFAGKFSGSLERVWRLWQGAPALRFGGRFT
jgi:hypothetical protein